MMIPKLAAGRRPAMLCLLLLGGMLCMSAHGLYAQTIIVVVEDLQGKHQSPGPEAGVPAEDNRYQLQLYVGEAPADTQKLVEIERIEVFDPQGQLVFSQNFYSQVGEIPLKLLGNGQREFHVYTSVGFFTGQIHLGP